MFAVEETRYLLEVLKVQFWSTVIYVEFDSFCCILINTKSYGSYVIFRDKSHIPEEEKLWWIAQI